MKKLPISDLSQIIKAKPLCAKRYKLNATLTGVSTDSRATKAGDCFFAITGNNFDGHDYVFDAFGNGAVCAVVSKDTDEEKLADRCILKVDDTIIALGRLAANYRNQSNFKVIAITGSAGKTSTRQITYHVLSRHYRCHQAPKNFNNNIGLPLTLLGAEPQHEIIIAELASNHPGEIEYLTKIARPDIALITNVQPAHLEGFGNLETVAAEKLSIAKGLQPNGALIINSNLLKWLNNQSTITNYKIITFGKSDQSDIKANNITYSAKQSRFTIDGTEVLLPLPGAGNVENTLAAFSVCSQFDININDFTRAVKNLQAVTMRTELLQIGTLTVLNDCYNANPASMKNALDILANLGSAEKRRLVFICGDMAELGLQTQGLHKKLGTTVPQANIRLLLAVGKFANITAEAAKKNAEYNLKIKSFKDTASACNNLHDYIKDDDIILVKGSRVARLEMVIEKLKEIFS
ncbi:MAG: UDP-N-acetylmuramoyl-tripeptide--D-alanyl-D-alanine ligase [Planctomycetota bacterium]|nr:MAG: UDP-N-acetylmuramoyl-tripeptide--D-alanyl-D-alanine ligase [Planctomycetota bacterium]